MKDVVKAREEEIRTLQRRYEDELEKRADIRAEDQAKSKQNEEKL